MLGLGRHHVLARPDAIGFLYIDGHVRVYTGTASLPKTHIARMRLAGPATVETWVGSGAGVLRWDEPSTAPRRHNLSLFVGR